MLFRNIVMAALVVSVVVGLLLGIAQHYHVSQIIYSAEVYEGGGEMPLSSQPHGTTGHSHEAGNETWAPEDGFERIFYTVISNIFAALGFGALLMVAMCLARFYSLSSLKPRATVLWGLAGFTMFFAAPSLGLPPEIPGMQAAPLEHRKLWWILTVLLTGAALALFAFVPGWKKLTGLVLLLVPHVFGAPHTEGPAFSHADPAAVLALEQLHRDFIVATTLTNAAFWVLLALLCGWAVQHWVLKHEEPIN